MTKVTLRTAAALSVLTAVLIIVIVITRGSDADPWPADETKTQLGWLVSFVAGTSFWSFLFFVLSWTGLLTIGVPLHKLLQRLSYKKLWHYIAAGQISGSVLGGLFLFLMMFPHGSLFPGIPATAFTLPFLISWFLIFYGGLAGGLFWHYFKNKPSS